MPTPQPLAQGGPPGPAGRELASLPSGQQAERLGSTALSPYAEDTAICLNCGEGNPNRARLCMMCCTALGKAPKTQLAERKVVSILFVDLVGFTSLLRFLSSNGLADHLFSLYRSQ